MHEKITQFTCQILALLTVFAVCRSRSMQPRPNFVDSSLASNQTVEQLFSKALTEEKLEDALKLFLEQWESRHGQKRGNKSISDEMMQADYPLVVPPSVWTRKRQVNPNSLLATGEPSKEHTNEDLSVDETEEGSKVNCTRCVMHEEARQRRLEEIKFDILNKLGMKQAPNVTSKTLPRIPPLHHLFDKYGILADEPQTLSSSSRPTQDLDEEQMHSDQPMDPDEEFEDFYVNTERAISFAQKSPDNLKIPSELKSQYFKFTAKVLNSHVTKAHLWIYVKPSAMHPKTDGVISGRIVVYQIVRARIGDRPTLMTNREKKIEVNVKKGSWVKVEVKKLLTHWSRYPSENLGIVVHSFDVEGREMSVSVPSEHVDETKRTFIEVHVETKGQNRKRRMIGLNCEENSNEVRCCRYPLTVDFEEFGWDWIIAPKRYEANYCSGECPYVFLQKYPHTHLVQQANPAGSAGPCCAPRKMSAISMLYFDDNYNIIYGMLPGMVVDRCGCS